MPSWAENSAASTMPTATPSPWNSRSENPVAASSAWPKVWPRLSSARSPVSRSSRATIAALARQEVAMACSRAAPPAKMSAWLASSQAKNAFVAEHTVFGDFGVAGAELARRQGVEHRGIGDHQHRLMKRAEQVFSLRRIDPGLAADRRIDLRQQRGRHLHEIDAAAQDRRGKAREIADHAAAERDHQIVALDLRRDQRLADPFEAGIGFRALALLDNDVRRARYRPATAKPRSSPASALRPCGR